MSLVGHVSNNHVQTQKVMLCQVLTKLASSSSSSSDIDLWHHLLERKENFCTVYSSLYHSLFYYFVYLLIY